VLYSLWHNLLGCLSSAIIFVNIVVCTTVLNLLSILKFLTPRGAMRNRVRGVLTRIAEAWASVNHTLIDTLGVRWDLQIPPGLHRDGCYVVNCNHQSWVDIIVLQKAFNRRIPFLRFFIKQQLIWVPFLGLSWWALDFPFMKRYSRAQLHRNPELRRRDLETARRACAKFRSVPVSMMNFLEGTRFTEAKKDRQNAPYHHLLKPRSGGLAQVLFSLGEQLDSMIDVTIIYPDGRPGMWDLVSGRLKRVVLRATEVPIPEHMRGRNYRSDRDFKRELEGWVTNLWHEKDKLIDSVLVNIDGQENP
jgi:1-acyl-sn-glycerol-3-phosphate acyltransferase